VLLPRLPRQQVRFLVLSNKRLLFLHEKGISSDFDKIVDVPYDEVADCSCVDRNLIAIKTIEKFR